MNIKSAWLTTNRSCNNKCDWCYARNALSEKSLMDIEKAKKIIDQLVSINVKKIILIGGEPTIYEHFVELIQYIHSKGLIIALASNGRRFANKDFARETVEAGVNGIDISLKATSEEDYVSKTHSKGLMEMLQGYKNLVELGFQPSISYVVVNDDKEEFEKDGKICTIYI